MKYTLTRIDPDAPVERYPQEQRQTVDDPLAQEATRGIMMGRLEEVLQDTVNWGRKNSLALQLRHLLLLRRDVYRLHLPS